MAVTVTPYRSALVSIGSADIDLNADAFKVALLGTGYTPDAANHDNFNDLTGEITGSPYVAGGAALTVTYGVDTSISGAKATVAMVSWTAATFSGVRYAVVYKNTGTSSSSSLLYYVDFGASLDPAGSTFALQWPTALLRIRPPA